MDLKNVLQSHTLFYVNLFGINIPISDSIIMMWIIMAVIIILAFAFTRNLKIVPTGKQNITETIVDGINGLIKSNMGEHWRPFAPYFGTLIIFLFFANMVELFNIFPTAHQLYNMTHVEFFNKIPNFSVVPPTKDLNVTITMALISIFLIPFSAIKYKGVKGWLKSFVKPLPIMLPFNILDYATRTLSLSLRLFGNILAGYIIIEMLYNGIVFVKPVIPFASAFFDMFDAALQAYIFVFLSSLYISEVIE
ncbi:MAG: F0F1 ATP synthase subunit A [Bacillota bacterium]|nr:F0F1 ATP synthase subunit A [Bacillota bacterium]